MSTKQQFLAALRRELARHEWAKDMERLDRAMEHAAQALNGRKTCLIDSESWKTAWKEIGMNGKPTYKSLHALPESEVA